MQLQIESQKMMNMDESKASHVLAAKSARPCDSCLIKRARWFCAADDAFLCQSCDLAVHSANQLASRHQRVRLETSSCTGKASPPPPPPPAWFTKKARTPRPPKVPSRHHLPLVPEMGSDDAFPDDNEEQLFCRVPVFDPFADEFGVVFDDDQQACPELNLEELLGDCDAELAVLGADSGCGGSHSATGKRVKIEEEDDEVGAVIASHLDPALDMKMNWEFDSMIVELREEMKKEDVEKADEAKRMTLRLNYEAVIKAWAPQGCPWTDGIRPPQFDIDEFMGSCLGRSCGKKWAGREARVSRYREKRRTRLFSKKIRYEVRKLNAEKRPRMKGRFVKRTPFLGSSLPHHYHLPSHQ